MKCVKIFQTLENRGNRNEVEVHGPYFCSLSDPYGNIKQGVKEPWLGEGYYFWDTLIDDAHWWGRTVYEEQGYLICQTTYDQHSELLYDTVANVDQMKELVDCAEVIKQERNLNTVTFALVLGYLRKRTRFNYKAIRVHPSPITWKQKDVSIVFPDRDKKIAFLQLDKVQICFFDKTLLTNPFVVIYSSEQPADFVI